MGELGRPYKVIRGKRVDYVTEGGITRPPNRGEIIKALEPKKSIKSMKKDSGFYGHMNPKSAGKKVTIIGGQ